MKKILLYAVLAIMLAGCATPRAPGVSSVEPKLRGSELATVSGFILAKGPKNCPCTSLQR
ncbi:MAG: lipoprotein [Syntrophobacteraceae bacterium]|jgi:uncharacterized lipoprotein YajG